MKTSYEDIFFFLLVWGMIISTLVFGSISVFACETGLYRIEKMQEDESDENRNRVPNFKFGETGVEKQAPEIPEDLHNLDMELIK